MAKKKTPERVKDAAWPEEARGSDLVEIAKRCGELREHYGRFWGGLLLLSLTNAAVGRRPFLWGGLISLGTVAGGLALKFGLHGLY